MCEGAVERIEGLSHCTKLTALHLYSNQIARIEGLVTLTRLEKLWLNGNRISVIEVSIRIGHCMFCALINEWGSPLAGSRHIGEAA